MKVFCSYPILSKLVSGPPYARSNSTDGSSFRSQLISKSISSGAQWERIVWRRFILFGFALRIAPRRGFGNDVAEFQGLSVGKVHPNRPLLQAPGCKLAAPHEGMHLGQFATALVTPCSRSEDAGQAGRGDQPDTLAT